jgi:hypothetical protein
MTSRIRVRPVSTVPRNTQVRDYDQLSPKAKRVFADVAAERTTVTVPSRVAACFDRDEIINYTDYLRVET